MRSYSVLDPVSQAYPKVQGRSPTCYSPVRHSSTPKGLSVRLACVKHAASVRPEPESNSPNKNNPTRTAGRWNSLQKNLKPNKTPKTGIKKHPPLNGKKRQTKKQQTKTTKHTIEFSNNTPGFQATLPLYSTWSETSNLVRQSIWTGALGFSVKTTPRSAQSQMRSLGPRRSARFRPRG